MQRVTAALLVVGPEPPESSRHCLKILHLLPIELRIKFKVLCLVFKSLHGQQPMYMREMLTERVPSRLLRSNNILVYKRLEIPKVKRETFVIHEFK